MNWMDLKEPCLVSLTHNAEQYKGDIFQVVTKARAINILKLIVQVGDASTRSWAQVCTKHFIGTVATGKKCIAGM